MSRHTVSALRELLGKAIIAVSEDDRPRALAALDQLGRLLEEHVAQQTRKPPVAPTKKKRLRCDDCGYFFKWPGQLEEHRRLRHPEIA